MNRKTLILATAVALIACAAAAVPTSSAEQHQSTAQLSQFSTSARRQLPTRAFDEFPMNEPFPAPAPQSPLPPPPLPAPSQGPQVTRIEIVPANASVPRGQMWPFQVRTFDANNNQIPTPPGVVLSVDSTILGTFDPNGPQGLYRAPMDFRTTIRARLGTVSGTASVTITP